MTIVSAFFQNPQAFLKVLPQNLLGLGEIIFLMEPVVHLQKRLFPILPNVHGLSPGGVRPVIGGSIKALFAGFQQAAFIAAVDAFFLTADRVWAFPIR
jgi:hypothetical protein